MPINRRSRVVGIELKGGLGNQLFQYAAALALARRQQAEVRLDTRLYRQNRNRQVLLDRLGIRWAECRHPETRGILRAFKRAFEDPFNGAIFYETRFSFMPEYLELRAPVYLIGDFQSWRYFPHIEAELRRFFDLALFSNANTSPFEASILAAENPVMVHVRRGDYLSNPRTLAWHGLIGRDYYLRARSLVEDQRGTASWFIFSDDPGEARRLLGNWPRATFVSGLSDLEDLMLMCRCKDFIIANSSFSWWAAWLGGGQDKVVIAPERWFAPGPGNITDTHDLYAPGWITT